MSDVPPTPVEDADGMGLMEHLVELRNRLVLCVAVMLVAIILCYIFAPQIYGFLVAPLAKAFSAEGEPTNISRRLIYTNLTEAFFTYLGVAVWGGFVITLPLILIQVWRFLAPGLYGHERRLMLPYFFLTPVLFLAGAAMAYYVVFPAAWHFFISFEAPPTAGGLPIQLEARVGEYLSLAMSLIMAFGLAFEMPLALVLLVQLGILDTAKLRAFRRFAVVINFVVAAILTPPDVLSQLMLAVPLCIFYELAILAARVIEKNRLVVGKSHRNRNPCLM